MASFISSEDQTYVGDVPVLDAVELALPPGGLMPPRVYTSRVFHDLEMSSVFPSSWVFVGHEQWVRNPGDYLTEQIGTEPVLVVNDGDALRAFVNVCPHRASLLVEGEGNCGRRLVCPYHGWTFELDGRLSGIPRQNQFESPIDRERLGLRDVRVDSWEGLVFVNVTGDAPPLLEYLEDVPTLLGDHDIRGMKLGIRLDDPIRANWKLVMDNAICDYHLATVHGESIAALVELDGVVDRSGRTTAVASVPWTEEARPDHAWPGLTRDAALGSLGCYVFPNLHVIGFPTGGATVMWWTPTAVDRTRARVLSLSHQRDDDVRAGADLLASVQREDFDVCEKMQIGVASSYFRPGPRHSTELRIKTFQQRLLQVLAGAVHSAGNDES